MLEDAGLGRVLSVLSKRGVPGEITGRVVAAVNVVAVKHGRLVAAVAGRGRSRSRRGRSRRLRLRGRLLGGNAGRRLRGRGRGWRL